MIDFSLGIYPQYAQLFMQLPKQAASWTTYIDVFNGAFWILLIVSIVIAALMFHCVFKFSHFQVIF